MITVVSVLRLLKNCALFPFAIFRKNSPYLSYFSTTFNYPPDVFAAADNVKSKDHTWVVIQSTLNHSSPSFDQFSRIKLVFLKNWFLSPKMSMNFLRILRVPDIPLPGVTRHHPRIFKFQILLHLNYLGNAQIPLIS